MPRTTIQRWPRRNLTAACTDIGGIAMAAKVGDRIVVESERMDVPPREGVILEVIEHETRPEFRVRWSDDHETSIRPAGGGYRILPAKVPARS
jgi:hypothetical protein